MIAVTRMLRDEFGLNAETLGAGAVDRAMRERMRVLGLGDRADYLEQLRSDNAEWTHFVQHVLVTETWFFRDAQAFGAVARWLMSHWKPRWDKRPARILSLPCSSGEEPYSMAMALLDRHLPAHSFAIDAVDLSTRALAQARRAVYSRNSFRGADLGFRLRHFQPSPDGYVLASSIRDMVRFSEGNLLDEHWCPPSARYDVVLCRNLLIYFDPAQQARAVNRLRRLILPGGILCVSPAEQALVTQHGFAEAGLFCGFRPSHKRARHGTGTLPRLATVPAHPPAVLDPGPLHPLLPKSDANHPAPPDGPTFSALEEDLARARHLADTGRLTEADRLCRVHLRANPSSAQAYYLLGLIGEASGDLAAPEHYRRALYLDPQHRAALLQMALIAQKKGDAARARNFNNRAARIAAKP